MNREFFINTARTCAVTGHRILGKDFDKKALKKTFLSLIDGGYENFLIGMALGFDTECFLVLDDIKKQKNIKIIACIPCLDQDEKFTLEQKKLYKSLVEKADERIVLSQNYTDKCMMDRNRFMVDNCSTLLCYKRKDFGGTAATVRYAEKLNKMIINL